MNEDDPIPADANANLDHFTDQDRKLTLSQDLEEELNRAPWRKDKTLEALNQMEHISKAVKPAYKGFWQQNDADIIK